MKWFYGVLMLLFAGGALAQTSQFDVTANGTQQDVPTQVANDLRKDRGRVEITIVPDQITSGSQNFLRSDQWGFWLWTNELHGQFFLPDGTRKLIRIRDDSDDPLPGTEAIAGQSLSFELNWSPSGVGLFVDGTLRLYMEGEFNLPGSNLVYGASTTGSSPYTGSISASVFSEPRSYDPCSNYPNWGFVQTFTPSGQSIDNVVPPLPTCQTVPDPDAEPSIIVDGTAVSTFSWNAPTKNENGSALAADKIKEYRLFWGDQSRIGRCTEPSNPTDSTCYPNLMTVPNGGEATSHPVTFSMDDDMVLFVSMITVVDDKDGEPLVSKWSNEVARAFRLDINEPEPEPDTPVPGPPTGVDVTFQTTCTTNKVGVTCEFRVEQP